MESHENLDRLDQEFLTLERNPADKETLASIFRTVHTLKGTSGLLGYKRLEKLAHSGENLLSRLRSGQLRLQPEMASTLLTMVDVVRAMLASVESSGTEGNGDYSGLLTSLDALAEGRSVPAPVREQATQSPTQVATHASPSGAGLNGTKASASSTSAGIQAPPSAAPPFVKEFVAESHESLDRLDQEFAALERNPGDKATLANIFRTIRTLKGSSGVLGFKKLERLAHSGERLLGRLRSGELELTTEMVSALLALADVIHEMLGHIERSYQDGHNDASALIDTLTRLSQSPSGSEAPSAVPEHRQPSHQARNFAGGVPAPPIDPAEEPHATPKEAPAVPSVADSTLRVDVSLLDKLMNLVGELVLARNRLLQFSVGQEDHDLVAVTQRLNHITTDLQERVMKVRMQPIGNIWSKFPRLVRDLCAQCGKEVQLVLEGQETELDKTLLEAIKDPLTHIVRNAVDHGIEPPQVRQQCGKPTAGRLQLCAYHEGGQVNIEITDDGGGIDLARVRHKAVEKGLLTTDQAARLNDRQALEMIFLPGFSTAEKTTTVSGRGVGMDVVRTNVERIGGSMDIQTRLGEGTTLKIKIPLTLAIIPGLLITCRGERFAIPQTSLVELLRVDPAQGGAGIEMVYGAPVYRLRGKLLPLAFLDRELRLQAGSPSAGSVGPVDIVVLQAEGCPFGLVVDDIHDTEEIVVKPMGRLRGLPCFAGATILGDGRVALILDVVGLALHSGVLAKLKERSFADASESHEQREAGEPLLLFDLDAQTRMAIPLAKVSRLEVIVSSRVERSGGLEVFQQRGQIIPLVRLAQFLSKAGATTDTAGSDELHVVVHSAGNRSVGLVVACIHDIVQKPFELQHGTDRPGILGSAVVQDRVTDLVDVEGVIRTACPAFYAHATT